SDVFAYAPVSVHRHYAYDCQCGRFSFSHLSLTLHLFFFFFFNAPATTEIYTLSLHDALPIYEFGSRPSQSLRNCAKSCDAAEQRSEEHTSELQSLRHLVCRLLLEKKKKKKKKNNTNTKDNNKKKVTKQILMREIKNKGTHESSRQLYDSHRDSCKLRIILYLDNTS